MTARTAVAAAEPPPQPGPLNLSYLRARQRTQPAVWVRIWNGGWRLGTVLRVAERRVQIRYVADRAGTVHERWFRTVGRSDDLLPTVYDGSLPRPQNYRCTSPACALVRGLPGQTVEQIRTAHEADPKHAAGSN